MPKHVVERILAKVKYEHGCWIFHGARDPNGYGRINPCDGESVKLAHRVLYEYLREKPRLDLDHLCRNPSCVNPWHLEDVTHAENMRRGARPERPSHCPKGHEYTPANLRNRPGKGAECRQCCTDDNLARYRRKRKLK